MGSSTRGGSTKRKSERGRESAGKQFTRNSPRRALGDWRHSYLSPRQSVLDCNPSPSFLHTTATATATATTTPFRSAPATPICPLSAFPNVGLRYRPSRDEESAKVSPSLTGILNTGDSSVLFLSSVFHPLSPTAQFPFLSRSSRPVGGIRERDPLTDIDTRHNAVTARSLLLPCHSQRAKIEDIIGRYLPITLSFKDATSRATRRSDRSFCIRLANRLVLFRNNLHLTTDSCKLETLWGETVLNIS